MNDLIAGITGAFDVVSEKLKFSARNLVITLGFIVGASAATAAVELGLDAMNNGIEKRKTDAAEPAGV